MTDRDDHLLTLTRRLYALTGVADWDGAAGMLTDDFFVTEAPGLPFGGVYRGRNALRDLYGTVMGMMDVAGIDIHGMTAGGNWVIVLVDIVARDEAGGDLRLSIAEAMRFRGDLVCEIKPFYFDHAAAQRAVAAKRTTV